MELAGLLNYGVFMLTLAAIYAVMTLGLNLQWGFTGQFNIGVVGFFAAGAYTAAILTTEPSNVHLGGFALPFVVGLAGAMVVSGILAFFIGLITLNLRTDYLAIATIGIAEIVRLFLKNEDWLTNGVRGITEIPKPLDNLGVDGTFTYLGVVLVVLALTYVALHKGHHSPWGRVLRAIRESEPATQASGKNVFNFRIQAFVLGSMVMGLAGALYAHFFGFISPEAFTPEIVTFLVWVMLIAGGSGNNRGALLGTAVIWTVWAGTDFLTSQLPAEYATQAGALRLFLIGVLVQVILLWKPEGLLPERHPTLKAREVDGDAD